VSVLSAVVAFDICFRAFLGPVTVLSAVITLVIAITSIVIVNEFLFGAFTGNMTNLVAIVASLWLEVGTISIRAFSSEMTFLATLITRSLSYLFLFV